MAYLQTFLSSALEIGADLLVLSGLHLVETQTESVRNDKLRVSSNEMCISVACWVFEIPSNIDNLYYFQKKNNADNVILVTMRHGC